jgi:hypothetical protein
MRRRRSWLQVTTRCLAVVVLLVATSWAAAALAIDLPMPAARFWASGAYLIGVLGVSVAIRGFWRKIGAALVGFVLVLAWWLSIEASNDRNWQKDVDRTAWADIEGDTVTIHNVRNFDYRSETDYTARWETRTYSLNNLRGADLFVTFWGSPWIAHPIVSFQFGENDHVAMSVETRKEVGEEYSALLGFFRQYELINIVGDERDLIRLRTNYRKGEEVYIYRTTVTPENARAIFLDYLVSVNALHDRPAFYNAITSNCTTNIRVHTEAVAGVHAVPWNWRLLLNGKGDEYAYEHGRLKGNLPFQELKRQAHINDAARGADQAADFSKIIRLGRAGFGD